MLTPQDLSNSVDPFTGSVRFSLPLVNLSGPRGLDTRLGLSYSGAMQQASALSNLEAPTGILGLGWSLDAEFIFAIHNGSAAQGSATLFYASSGVSSRLIALQTTGTVTTWALENAQAWTISYDTSTLAWTVIKEDGTTFTFGNAQHDTTRHTIQWGVRWGAFIGDSAQTTGQTRFPVIWNLSTVANTSGDTLTFTWSSFSDDQIAVGTGGLTYTRASYLVRIDDPWQRSITLQYGARLGPGNAQVEYVPPHSGASATPNAWQDRYETRFLQSVAVQEQGQPPHSTFTFGYKIVGAGALAKRRLTSITESFASGASAPPLTLTWVDDTSNPQLGVLQSVTLGEGASATWTYAANTPALANRSFNAFKPWGSPRLWFDDAYTVVTWYDAANFTAHLFVYFWDGKWTEFSDTITSIKSADYNNLTVFTDRQQFAILRHFPDGSYTLYCYRKRSFTSTAWTSTSFSLSSLTSGEPTALVGGHDFVAVLGQSSGKVYRVRWTGTAWTNDGTLQLSPQPGSKSVKYAVAARNNYLATAACYENKSDGANINYQLCALTSTGVWATPQTLSAARPVDDVDQLALYDGDTLFVVRTVDEGLVYNSYAYQAIRWDDQYNLVAPFTFPAPSNTATGYVDVQPAIRGGMVGLGPLIARFDGQSWITLDLTLAAYRYPNQNLVEGVFAYGFDKVNRRVTIVVTSEPDYTFDLSAYNPASGTWAVDSFQSANLPSKAVVNWSFVPIASHTVRFASNYSIVYDEIWYQNPDLTWTKVGTLPDKTIQSYASTVQQLGSNYISYQNVNDAQVLLLRNGGVTAPLTLSGQKIDQWVGIQSFCTYTGSSSSPSALTLHRVVRNDVQGTVSPFVVTLLTLDDNLDVRTTAFSYDTSNASADPSGNYPLFNTASVQVGAEDASSQPWGTTRHRFYNNTPGLPLPVVQGDSVSDASGLLTGNTYQRDAVDPNGQTVGSDVYTWTVWLAALAQASQGAYNRLTTTVSTVDGVATTQTRLYTSLGLLNATALTNTRADQSTEVINESYLYAADAYPASPLKSRNILTPIAQVLRTSVVGGTTSPMRSTVMTWQAQGNGVWGPHREYQAISSNQTFDFNAWGGSQEPPATAWQKLRDIRAINSAGLPTEWLDQDGAPVSALYDSARRFTVARFDNASLSAGEVAFYSFEPYETGAGWTITTPGHLDTSDAWIGTTSLRVDAQGGQTATALQTTLNNTSNRSFAFAFWARTTAGFGADGGAAWVELALTVGGNTTRQRVTLTDTQNAWAFFSSAALQGTGAAATLALAVTTQKQSASFFIDAIRITPTDALTSATAWRPLDGLPSAELGPNFETKRHLYDSRSRRIVEAFGDEPRSLTILADPNSAGLNALAQLNPQLGGAYARFNAGAFTFSAPTRTQTTARTLQITGAGLASATWRGWSNQQDYGARVQLQATGAGAPTGEVGLTLGSWRVSWTPGATQGTWKLNGTPIVGWTQAPFAFDWAIAVIDGRLLFWADGQLLIDNVPSSGSVGTLVLDAASPVIFTDLVIFSRAELRVLWLDGALRERQVLDFISQTALSLHATLYDDMERSAITTRAATSTAATLSPLLGFRASFVTNGGTGGSLWTTGVLQGDLASAWPADQGFPYWRSCFEPSPLGRLIEEGQPGKNFAVGQHSTKYQYQGESGVFFMKTTTDPNGNQIITTSDKAGNLLQRKVGTAAGGWLQTSYAPSWNSAGRLILESPPNATGNPPDPAFRIAWQYDFLDQLVQRSDADSGASQAIYDPAGRVRFTLDANGRGAGPSGTDIIAYASYDALGRFVGSGTTAYAWSNLPAWIAAHGYAPPGTTTPCRAAQLVPPGSPFSGRLQSMTTQNPAGAVVESWTYDGAGRIASITLNAAGQSAQTVGYTYNALGYTTRIDYPAGCNLQVNYLYDRRGQVSSIGNATAPAFFASYQYNPDRSVQTEQLGFLPTPQPTFQYNSPGWLTQINTSAFQQTILYDASGASADGTPYFNGFPASSSSNALWANAPAPTQYTWQYGYDDAGRITLAQNTARTDWWLSGLSYDGNGNILALRRGSGFLKGTLAPHTDQLTAVSGQDNHGYTWDKNGNATSRTPEITQITYHPVLRRPTQLTLAQPQAQTINLLYGAQSQRVLKVNGAASRLYVHGLNDAPLCDIVQGASPRTEAYVFGPAGRVALVSGANVYRIVRDSLGSTRLLLNNDGSVAAAFDYWPFGGILRTSGDDTLTPYLFTGQEADAFDPAGHLTAGLVYNFRARLYDPVTGRFLGPDPRSQFASPYLYAANNPALFTDPTGEFVWFLLAILLAATLGAAVGFAVGLAQGKTGNDLFRSTLAGTVIGAGLALGPAAAVAEYISWTTFGVATASGLYAGYSLASAKGASIFSADGFYYLAAGLATSYVASVFSAGLGAPLDGTIKGAIVTGFSKEAVLGFGLSMASGSSLEDSLRASLVYGISGAIEGGAIGVGTVYAGQNLFGVAITNARRVQLAAAGAFVTGAIQSQVTSVAYNKGGVFAALKGGVVRAGLTGASTANTVYPALAPAAQNYAQGLYNQGVAQLAQGAAYVRNLLPF